ncbi:MAG: hypothetical protein GDA48_12045 [Hormoscilla sp. GM102CHS1]|nr:hypothetical protein [Hormoscilla sp. GM102CHS1]
MEIRNPVSVPWGGRSPVCGKKPGFCHIFWSRPEVEIRNPVSIPTGWAIAITRRGPIAVILNVSHPDGGSLAPPKNVIMKKSEHKRQSIA